MGNVTQTIMQLGLAGSAYIDFYAGCPEGRPCLKIGLGIFSFFLFFFPLHGSLKFAH